MEFPAEHYFQTAAERLRLHLKKITGYQRIKGDYLKEQSRRFLGSVQRFVDKGVVQWRL